MMKEPWFWRETTFAARLTAASLTPAAAIYNAARKARRALTRPFPAPLPILCVGNATLGGVGKTPFALMLAKLLKARGLEIQFLTRGYGGAFKGPMKVDADTHDAASVGDEALLLARAAPTWVSHDRPAGALAARLAGADAVVMDDGFQNPALEKTFSFFLVDAEDPVGNGRLFPAGPLREPQSEALARAGAVVFVLAHKEAPRPPAPAGVPAFYVWLEPAEAMEPARVVAFCGIGRPQRFFSTLQKGGFEIVDAIGFPDHHAYAAPTLRRLAKTARDHGAKLITTEKDWIRIEAALRQKVTVFRVEMACDNAKALAALAMAALARDLKKESDG